MKASLAIVIIAVAASALGSVVRESTCPQYSDHDVLLPSEECSKYIVCAHGIPIEMSCPTGLNYNVNTKECDWPEHVDCENRHPEPEVEEFVPPFEALPNGCPVDSDIHWMVNDRENCNDFYYCVFGEIVKMSCPAQLHFNIREQLCDYPEKAGCQRW